MTLNTQSVSPWYFSVPNTRVPPPVFSTHIQKTPVTMTTNESVTSFDILQALQPLFSRMDNFEMSISEQLREIKNIFSNNINKYSDAVSVSRLLPERSWPSLARPPSSQRCGIPPLQNARNASTTNVNRGNIPQPVARPPPVRKNGWRQVNSGPRRDLPQQHNNNVTHTNIFDSLPSTDEIPVGFTLNYKEGDIFQSNLPMAHCVGADFNMGKGFALEIKERYGNQTLLRSMEKKKGEVATLPFGDLYVFYLVTKIKSRHTPRLCDIRKTLFELLDVCNILGVKHIAIPRICTYNDKQDWDHISHEIKLVFSNSGMVIDVYDLPPELAWKRDMREPPHPRCNQQQRGERPPRFSRTKRLASGDLHTPRRSPRPATAPHVVPTASSWTPQSVQQARQQQVHAPHLTTPRSPNSSQLESEQQTESHANISTVSLSPEDRARPSRAGSLTPLVCSTPCVLLSPPHPKPMTPLPPAIVHHLKMIEQRKEDNTSDVPSEEETVRKTLTFCSSSSSSLSRTQSEPSLPSLPPKTKVTNTRTKNFLPLAITKVKE